jgi:hemerythrin-like domain-containing protein
MPPTKKATTKRAASTGRGAAKKTSSSARDTAAGTSRTAKKAAGTAKKATQSSAAAAKTTAKKAAAPAKKAVGSAKKAASSVDKAAAPVRKAASAAKRAASGGDSGTTSRRRGGERDAIELLTADHREVDDLFVRFERAGKGAQKRRQQLVAKMVDALSMHAAIEEQVFYPMARQEVPDTNDDVLEALEEHHLVKVTLSELERLDPGDERFVAKVTVLMENVRHHVEEEENELFPEIRNAIGDDRLREIGRELAEAKRTAPTRPHPGAPDTPPGNIIAQAISAPFDVAANVTEATARRVRDLVT